MNKPHKHAELIKAWADGAEIQYKDEDLKWVNCGLRTPTWRDDHEYRIKPEQKADVKKKFGFTYDTVSKQVKHFFIPQIEVTFDAQTGDVKHIEVLK